jgi:hypothetical protein
VLKGEGLLAREVAGFQREAFGAGSYSAVGIGPAFINHAARLHARPAPGNRALQRTQT